MVDIVKQCKYRIHREAEGIPNDFAITGAILTAVFHQTSECTHDCAK